MINGDHSPSTPADAHCDVCNDRRLIERHEPLRHLLACPACSKKRILARAH